MQSALPAAGSTESRQIRSVLDAAHRRLGNRLVGAYLFGSATAEGLQKHSDLDILLAVLEPLSPDMRAGLTADLLAISDKPGRADLRPLEVTALVLAHISPWRYPPMREYQFGEWLRSEFEAGEIDSATPDPDLAILVKTARQRGVALLGPPAAELFDPVPEGDILRAIADILPDVMAGWHEDERNALLALCRMWATATTGKILSKDAAAEWALEHLPTAHRFVIERARHEYLGKETQDWLVLRDQVRDAAHYLEGRIDEALRG